MSLYPSLEDMQMDKLIQTQKNLLDRVTTDLTNKSNNELEISSAYPDLFDCLGLDLTNNMIRENMPEYMERNNQAISTNFVAKNNLIAPLTSQITNIPERAQVTHNLREVILCKDVNGKVGIRVQAINLGVFVSIVVKNSPAALAGIRFGDQILQINGTLVAGFSVTKIHNMLKASDKNNITIVLRDRPFERTITLVKDSTGHLGFQFNNGKIMSIVLNSSAARNGLLTEHNILEINGQTVVALKDKDITQIINSAENVVKITIIPSFLYEQMVKKLSTSFLRGIMDHSTIEF